MTPRFRMLPAILAFIIAVASLAALIRLSGGSDIAANNSPAAAALPAPWQEQPAPEAAASSTSAKPGASSSPQQPPAATIAPSTRTPKQAAALRTAAPAPAASSASGSQITRIQNPYPTPPESLDQANAQARAALVNILCMSGGSIRPISGSGVIIDSRGVILTNAHVAQYVLLAESSSVNISCTVRTGSPARSAWIADVLYMPSAWVDAHASEINSEHLLGTGEHDYALLRLTGAIDGGVLPSSFPYLPVDAREAIGFPGDEVLVASYPAEFLGGITAENDLYADTSDTTVKELLTFGSGSVDLISLGGVIEAQSGSSGGAIVNPWGRLIALITTTSAAGTTAGRDLHAITLSYIDRDLAAQTSEGLAQFLAGDLSAKEDDFNANAAPGFLQRYFDALKAQQQ